MTHASAARTSHPCLNSERLCETLRDSASRPTIVLPAGRHTAPYREVMPVPTPFLVFNAGSSSLKYRLITGEDDVVAATIEHIGEPGGPADHAAAAARAIDALRAHDAPVAIGHRVVHGGDELRTPTVIDDAIEAAIDRWTPLAPTHNPAALAVIRVARTA